MSLQMRHIVKSHSTSGHHLLTHGTTEVFVWFPRHKKPKLSDSHGNSFLSATRRKFWTRGGPLDGVDVRGHPYDFL